MNKALKALYEISEGMSNKGGFIKEFKLIQQALTPPTEEEVCEALSEYYGFEVMYKGGDFFPKERLSNLYCVVAMVDGCIDFAYPLPPHLITLIGRFYEGVKKGG